MTRDPLFAFNDELGDVSNVHTITGKAKCSTSAEGAPVSWKADAITLTFADGDEITVEGPFEQCSNVVMEDSAMGGQPAAAEIQVLTASGEAEVVAPEDVEKRDMELDRVGMIGGIEPDTSTSPPETPPDTSTEPSPETSPETSPNEVETGGGTKKSSGGCRAAHHGTNPWGLTLLLLGFFFGTSLHLRHVFLLGLLVVVFELLHKIAQ